MKRVTLVIFWESVFLLVVSDNNLRGKLEHEAKWTSHPSATIDAWIWALEARRISERGTLIAVATTSVWVQRLEKKAGGKWIWALEARRISERGTLIAVATTSVWVQRLEKKAGGKWIWALEGRRISETGTNIADATASAWVQRLEKKAGGKWIWALEGRRISETGTNIADATASAWVQRLEKKAGGKWIWALEGRRISETGACIADATTSAWVQRLEKKAGGKWIWALEGRRIQETGACIADATTSAWVRTPEKKAGGKWIWALEGRRIQETGACIADATTSAWVRTPEKKARGKWLWALEGKISEAGTHIAIASIAIATTSAGERKIEEERVQVQQSRCNSSVPQVQGGTIVQRMREMWCWRCLAARQLVGAVHVDDRCFRYIYWHSWLLLHAGGSLQGVGSFCLGSETGACQHGENYSNWLFHVWIDQSIQPNFAGTLRGSMSTCICNQRWIKTYQNCFGFQLIILSFWVCRLRLVVSWVVKIFAKDPKSWRQMDPAWRWPIFQRCWRSAGSSLCTQKRRSFWDSELFFFQHTICNQWIAIFVEVFTFHKKAP